MNSTGAVVVKREVAPFKPANILSLPIPAHFKRGCNGQDHNGLNFNSAGQRSYNENVAETVRGLARNLTATNLGETAVKMRRWFYKMASKEAVSPDFKMPFNKRNEIFERDKESVVAQVFLHSSISKMGVEWDTHFVPKRVAEEWGDRSSPWGLPYPSSEPLVLLSKLGEIARGMKENDTVLGKTADQMVDAEKNVLEMYAKWAENSHKIRNLP